LHRTRKPETVDPARITVDTAPNLIELAEFETKWGNIVERLAFYRSSRLLATMSKVLPNCLGRQTGGHDEKRCFRLVRCEEEALWKVVFDRKPDSTDMCHQFIGHCS